MDGFFFCEVLLVSCLDTSTFTLYFYFYFYLTVITRKPVW